MKVSKILATSVASLFFAAAAHSASISWTGGDGVWANAGGWIGGNVPSTNDDVTLGAPTASVVYLNGSTPGLSSVVIDAAAGTSFLQVGGSITSQTVIVGNTGVGSYTHTGGTLQVNGNTQLSHLILGAGHGGSGTYKISGGSLVANAVHVGGGLTALGWVASGTFEQSSGSVNITSGVGELVVGDSPGTSGLYLMKGGTLAATDIFVGVQGSNGSGRIFNQTAGTVTVNGTLALGGHAGGDRTNEPTGNYILSGEPTSQLFSAIQYVGVSGTGVFTQNGGTNNVTLGAFGSDRALLIGAYLAGSTGTYNMNSGVLNAEGVYIGNPGRGTFNHSGGTVNVTQQMIVDKGATGVSSLGRYVMTGGQLNTTGSGTTPGLLVAGVFQHNGGTITANGVGTDAGFRNDGTYAIAGGTLSGSGTKLNTGTFTGYGTISGTGKLINEGVMTFNGGTSTFNAPVENRSGRTMEVLGSIGVFNNSFTNRGTFRTIDSTVFFNGDFRNSGTIVNNPTTQPDSSSAFDGGLALSSDDSGSGGLASAPGVQTINGNWFHDEDSALVVSAPGGDLFRVRGNLEVTTTNREGWDTRLGILQFFKDTTTNGEHSLIYAGLDLGATYAPLLKKLPNGQEPIGFVPNFAWGEVIIDPDNILTTSGGGALYTDKLTLSGTIEEIIEQIALFTGDLKIFYDPLKNPVLDGGTYAFAEGSTGFVAPVPEPSSLVLLGFGAMTAGFSRLRRNRRG